MYTFWLVAFTAVLAVTASIQIRYLIRSDATATKAANAAVAAQRPWLSIEAEGLSPFNFEGGIGVAGLKITTKNIGNSPATRVRAFSSAVIRTTASPDDIVQTMLDELVIRSQSGAFENYGRTVFPKSSIEHEQGIVLNQKEMSEALKSNSGNTFILPLLAVYVEYQFAGGEGQTYALFDLWQKHPETGHRCMIDTSDHAKIRGVVQLQRVPFWDSAK